MQVTIKGETRYIPVSTITLQKSGEGVTFPFHCVACGNTHNVIGGKVTKIYPILEPSNQIPVISTCRSCKAKYTFQDSSDTKVTDSIKVLLNPKPERQAFYCYLGGGEDKSLNKLLEYEKGKIYSYEEGIITNKNPFYLRCRNTDCGLTYQFTQLS